MAWRTHWDFPCPSLPYVVQRDGMDGGDRAWYGGLIGIFPVRPFLPVVQRDGMDGGDRGGLIGIFPVRP